jgi:hypothetical protein
MGWRAREEEGGGEPGMERLRLRPPYPAIADESEETAEAGELVVARNQEAVAKVARCFFSIFAVAP